MERHLLNLFNLLFNSSAGNLIPMTPEKFLNQPPSLILSTNQGIYLKVYFHNAVSTFWDVSNYLNLKGYINEAVLMGHMRWAKRVSSTTQHALTSEFGRKWGGRRGKGGLNTKFHLPTLLHAGFSVKKYMVQCWNKITFCC